MQRGYVQVNEKMQALDEDNKPIKGLWCIGDLNGKMMLAHAASAQVIACRSHRHHVVITSSSRRHHTVITSSSRRHRAGIAHSSRSDVASSQSLPLLTPFLSTQGISAVENIVGNSHVLNHDAVPAACFTHPEVAMVGPTEERAREMADELGFELGVSTGNFRANSKVGSRRDPGAISAADLGGRSRRQISAADLGAEIDSSDAGARRGRWRRRCEGAPPRSRRDRAEIAPLSWRVAAQVLFRKDSNEVLGVHIIGLHAADLIQAGDRTEIAMSSVSPVICSLPSAVCCTSTLSPAGVRHGVNSARSRRESRRESWRYLGSRRRSARTRSSTARRSTSSR